MQRRRSSTRTLSTIISEITSFLEFPRSRTLHVRTRRMIRQGGPTTTCCAALLRVIIFAAQREPSGVRCAGLGVAGLEREGRLTPSYPLLVLPALALPARDLPDLIVLVLPALPALCWLRNLRCCVLRRRLLRVRLCLHLVEDCSLGTSPRRRRFGRFKRLRFWRCSRIQLALLFRLSQPIFRTGDAFIDRPVVYRTKTETTIVTKPVTCTMLKPLPRFP